MGLIIRTSSTKDFFLLQSFYFNFWITLNVVSEHFPVRNIGSKHTQINNFLMSFLLIFSYPPLLTQSPERFRNETSWNFHVFRDSESDPSHSNHFGESFRDNFQNFSKIVLRLNRNFSLKTWNWLWGETILLPSKILQILHTSRSDHAAQYIQSTGRYSNKRREIPISRSFLFDFLDHCFHFFVLNDFPLFFFSFSF
jgi:hypothetical protein